jgi:MSHA biogenesis protein MshQ
VGSNGRINMNPIPQLNGVVHKNLKFRISFPTVAPTKIGCSNDAFALKPDRLVLANPTHGTWTTAGTAFTLNNLNATGGVVHKAGDASGTRNNFSLSASARDALGGALPAYTGSPAGGVSALQLPAGCATCAPGTFIAGAWSGTGTITSNTAAYTEVGSVTVHIEDRSFAAVDAIDSTTGERYIDSNPVSLGRFVPDHFDVATATAPIFRTFNATDGQCNGAVALPRRSFTYVGQSFGYATTPTATIIARNADPAGVTTTLYRGNLWKIGGAGAATPSCAAGTCTFTTAYGASGGTVAETYTYTLDTGATPGWDAASALAQVATVTSNNDGTGTISFAASDRLAFARSAAAPLAPFTATINNSIAVTDNAEGAAQTITTTNPAAYNSIAFDATYIDPVPANNRPNKFFYGRLRLQNANGSQLIAMPIPITTEYWNGSVFVTNNFDHCTGGAAASIAVANIAIGNLQTVTGMTTAMVSPPVLGGVFNAGRGSLRLPAPGAGRRGSVDVSVNLTGVAAGASCTAGMPASTGSGLGYLQGAWCGANADDDPTARATFGIYRNSNQFIYQQENY